MLLIKETIWNDTRNLIVEGKNGQKEYYIEGIFIQANKKNGNGRVNPLENIQEDVNRYNEEIIGSNRAMGELGHPDSPKINLERVSHVITSLKLEGSNYVGRAKILDTPYGKIAKNFIDEGIKLGVSSRGMGTLKNEGGIPSIQKDFRLCAVDIVANPSAPDAFVKGIMEGREWILSDGSIEELTQVMLQEQRKCIGMNDLERIKLEKFKAFCSKL